MVNVVTTYMHVHMYYMHMHGFINCGHVIIFTITSTHKVNHANHIPEP